MKWKDGNLLFAILPTGDAEIMSKIEGKLDARSAPPISRLTLR